MLKKFLKEVISLVVGKQAEDIVDLLDSKRYVNEFTLAKKLDITINQTRNILYKIADKGLVSSIRKKDKKKGWYTYFWKIEILKSLEFLKGVLVKRLDQLNSQISSRETKQFYICKRCSIEFNEENALLNEFTCNECGDIFTLKDNSKVLREFKKSVNKFEKELELVEVEINIESQKVEKKKQKEIKQRDKEKKEKAAAKRKLTQERKAREAKASGKVFSKKKIVKKKAVKKKKVVKKKAVKKKPAKKKKKVKKKVVKKKAVKKKKVVKNKPLKKVSKKTTKKKKK